MWGFSSDAITAATAMITAARDGIDVDRSVLLAGVNPDEVFADEVGRWIPAGIAQGIDAAAHLAVNASKDLAAQVTDAAQLGAVNNPAITGGGAVAAGLTNRGGRVRAGVRRGTRGDQYQRSPARGGVGAS